MANLEMMLKEIGTEKLVSQTAYDLLAKEIFAELKKKAEKSHRHSANDIDETEDKKFVPQTKITEWDAKVSKEQLESALGTLTSGLSWKGVHENLEALKIAIPSPKEGDFVIVTQEPKYKNKNTMLIYEAESINDWQTIGELFVPGKATASADGLMSKEDKVKLDGINVATNLVQDGERAKWNKASTEATQALEKAGQNASAITTKADKTTQVIAGNGLQGGGDLTANRTLSVKADGDSIVVGASGIKVDVVNDLSSDSTTKALGAKQGKALKGQIDGVSAKADANAQAIANRMSAEDAQAIIAKYKQGE